MDLAYWIECIHPRMAGMERWMTVDYRRESLTELDRLLAEPVSHAFANGCAAYLGETLLRVGGGGWIEVDGVPAVAADPVLGLPVVVPAEVLQDPG